jgi:hypothetical protein
MLLLAQHTHETIILETRDGPIELRLHVLDGEQARIGIDAPPSVRVVRHTGPVAPTPPRAPDNDDLDDAPWWQHPDD